MSFRTSTIGRFLLGTSTFNPDDVENAIPTEDSAQVAQAAADYSGVTVLQTLQGQPKYDFIKTAEEAPVTSPTSGTSGSGGIYDYLDQALNSNSSSSSSSSGSSSSSSSNTTTSESNTSAGGVTGVSASVLTADWSSYNISVVYSGIPSEWAVDEKVISSQSQYPNVFDSFDLRGYSPARMKVYTIENGQPIIRRFEFLIGPSSMSRMDSNLVNTVKTGQGYFLYRSGPDLTKLAITGVFVESALTDERKLFLEKYYKKYLVDKVNAFHEYFNETTLYLELMGYSYQCIPLSFELSQTANQMFIYNYNMSLLVLSENPLDAVEEPELELGDLANAGNVKLETVTIGSNISRLLASSNFGGLLSSSLTSDQQTLQYLTSGLSIRI